MTVIQNTIYLSFIAYLFSSPILVAADDTDNPQCCSCAFTQTEVFELTEDFPCSFEYPAAGTCVTFHPKTPLIYVHRAANRAVAPGEASSSRWRSTRTTMPKSRKTCGIRLGFLSAGQNAAAEPSLFLSQREWKRTASTATSPSSSGSMTARTTTRKS